MKTLQQANMNKLYFDFKLITDGDGVIRPMTQLKLHEIRYQDRFVVGRDFLSANLSAPRLLLSLLELLKFELATTDIEGA